MSRMVNFDDVLAIINSELEESYIIQEDNEEALRIAIRDENEQEIRICASGVECNQAIIYVLLGIKNQILDL